MKLARLALPLLVLAGLPLAADARSGALITEVAPSDRSLHETFRVLAGEWEGQIEVRDRDKTSASIISVSNRLSDDKSRLDSCFEGFAAGELFEGFAIFRHDGADLASAWSDSRRDDTLKTRGKSEPSERAFEFQGADRDERDKPIKVRQVIRVVDRDNYVHEWHTTRDGKDQVALKLTMKRLPANQKSTAAARFDDKPFLQKYGQSAVAAVSTD